MLLRYWGWQLPIKTSFSLVGFVDSCFVELALKCPWRWTPTKTCVQRCFGSMNMCTLFFGTVRTLTWLLLLHQSVNCKHWILHLRFPRCLVHLHLRGGCMRWPWERMGRVAQVSEWKEVSGCRHFQLCEEESVSPKIKHWQCEGQMYYINLVIIFIIFILLLITVTIITATNIIDDYTR